MGRWLAVVFGTAQNAVMMSLLLGRGGEAGPQVTYRCTLPKLALLIIGPAYTLLGWLALP